jgi:hypothetical protein
MIPRGVANGILGRSDAIRVSAALKSAWLHARSMKLTIKGELAITPPDGKRGLQCQSHSLASGLDLPCGGRGRVTQTFSLLYRRSPDLHRREVAGGSSRPGGARTLPTESRRYSRQDCLLYGARSREDRASS